MINHFKFLVIGLMLFLVNCHSNRNESSKALSNIDSVGVSRNNKSNLCATLSSLMKNPIVLDSFLINITHQENVKVLSELKVTWDDENGIYIYSDGIYNFKLICHDYLHSNIQKPNSIFIDGKTRISFENYSILCINDGAFRCEDYGFNRSNRLENPKIIEVCGRRFLYSDISYECNGMGCGCHITFIYDLQYHKPTFIENYRIPFNGFFVSDFNNDSIPDLMVIGSSLGKNMKGFDLEEFEIKLVPYSDNNGVFKPLFDNRFQRPYCYELYSIATDGYRDNFIYSITKENWFREQ